MSDSAQPATMIDWSHCVNERDSNRYDCIHTSVVIDSAYQSEVRLINISWTLDPDPSSSWEKTWSTSTWPLTFNHIQLPLISWIIHFIDFKEVTNENDKGREVKMSDGTQDIWFLWILCGVKINIGHKWLGDLGTVGIGES